MGLNIVGPEDKPGSKCWQALEPLSRGWPDSSISYEYSDDGRPTCFWGLANGNWNMLEQLKLKQRKFLFTDMGYFNRWNGDPDTAYWRTIPNTLHVNSIGKYPSDRSRKLGIHLRDWRKSGSHILVAPSSFTMSQWCGYNSEQHWINATVAELQKHTDRPIKIRMKPRDGKKSGPMVASVPLSEDLKDCWAIVTSCSMAAVEAVVAGVPSFTHTLSPAAPVSYTKLSKIENPHMPDRQAWINTLAYRQFTKIELANGKAYEILHQLL